MWLYFTKGCEEGDVDGPTTANVGHGEVAIAASNSSGVGQGDLGGQVVIRVLLLVFFAKEVTEFQAGVAKARAGWTIAAATANGG